MESSIENSGAVGVVPAGEPSCVFCDCQTDGSYLPHAGPTVWYVGNDAGERRLACEGCKDMLDEPAPLPADALLTEAFPALPGLLNTTDPRDDRGRFVATDDQLAAVGRKVARLRDMIARKPDPDSAQEEEVFCPVCQGPAIRVHGRHSGWYVQPTGCEHHPVHPVDPVAVARRERMMKALESSPYCVPINPDLPELSFRRAEDTLL